MDGQIIYEKSLAERGKSVYAERGVLFGILAGAREKLQVVGRVCRGDTMFPKCHNFFIPFLIPLLVVSFGTESLAQRPNREERIQQRQQIREDRRAQREQQAQEQASNSTDRPVLNIFREVLSSQLSQTAEDGPQETLLLAVLRGMFLSQQPTGELRPVYMVSLQNLDELDATLQKIAGDSGTKELYSGFRSAAQSWGESFMDTDRKSGLFLLTDGASTFPMLFIPLQSGDAAAYQFLATFGAESVTPQEGNGYRWTWLGKNPYIRFSQGTVVVQKGDWGYFVPYPLLAILPDNPQILLPQTDGVYLVSDTIFMDGLPRRLGNGLIRIGEIVVLFSNPKKAKYGPEQKEMLAGSLAFAKILVDEIETIFRGIKRNNATGGVTLETAVRVVPDGQLAWYIERQRNRQTAVRAFFQPDEALCAGIVSEELGVNQKRIAHAFVRYLFRDIETKMVAEQQQFAAESVKTETKIQAPSQSGEEAQTPGELVNAFSGMMGQFVGGVWNESLSTALQATKDQLEIESVHKFEAIVHENVQRGIFDGAITVLPGGNTVGAFQITGGEKIVAILSGAQLKINTDPRAAHLKGKVFFNSRRFGEFRISTIAFPVKELKNAENFPASLQEKILYINFGIREDRFCFTAGLEPDLLDVLEKAVTQLDETAPLPATTFVFSPYHFGKLLQPYSAEMTNRNASELVQTLLQANPAEQLTYTIAYAPATYYSTLVVPKAMFKALGVMQKK
ncbi:MAG: hypothetical protein FWC43_07255 [Planctomycetaceae bacterium]|nr:hypothetical protein [Planctomycetaceae bacterium]